MEERFEAFVVCQWFPLINNKKIKEKCTSFYLCSFIRPTSKCSIIGKRFMATYWTSFVHVHILYPSPFVLSHSSSFLHVFNDYNFKTNKFVLLSIFMQLMHMIVEIMPLSLKIVFAQGILLDHTFWYLQFTSPKSCWGLWQHEITTNESTSSTKRSLQRFNVRFMGGKLQINSCSIISTWWQIWHFVTQFF
jgi:hypothetical protein